MALFSSPANVQMTHVPTRRDRLQCVSGKENRAAFPGIATVNSLVRPASCAWSGHHAPPRAAVPRVRRCAHRHARFEFRSWFAMISPAGTQADPQFPQSE